MNGFGDIIHTDRKKTIQIVLESQSKEFELGTNTKHYEWIFTAAKNEVVDFKTAYVLAGKGRMYYEKENESCVNEKTFEIRTDEIHLEGLSLCCLE